MKHNCLEKVLRKTQNQQGRPTKMKNILGEFEASGIYNYSEH